nr:hypothetical protein [uncultured Duganella sp.]
MNRNEREARLVAEYKQLSAEKRATRRVQRSSPEQPSGSSSGTITIPFAPDAKPVSELGGPTKVFGPSKINIPEFRWQKQV